MSHRDRSSSQSGCESARGSLMLLPLLLLLLREARDITISALALQRC